MKLPLQITFHGMEPSEALEAAAAKKAHKLEEFCSDIMSCRVVIEQLQKAPATGSAEGHRHLELFTSQAQRCDETIEREAAKDARLPHAG